MDGAIENIARKIHDLFREWAAVAKPTWIKRGETGPYENQTESQKAAYRHVARGILEHLPILEIKT